MNETMNGLGKPSCNGAANDWYECDDWTLFRTIRSISQHSGVPPELLRRLLAKELADNALDAGGTCRVGELEGDGFFVEDDGPGIGGGPEEVARLFSFRRPRVSSKFKRLPTRGALGNGLRVVAGAVFASAGSLRVITGGQVLDLTPQESGETQVKRAKPASRAGTRVEVRLGEAVPEDDDFLEWAECAINAAEAAGWKPVYSGKTSPHWYDSDSAFELFKAAGSRNVEEVMREFEGGDRLTVPGRLSGRRAASLSDGAVEELLALAREHCAELAPKRLALAGKGLGGHHAKEYGVLVLEPGRGRLRARLPYTVEVWCNPSCGDLDHVRILVNRTPVTGDVGIERAKAATEVTIFGCNLGFRFNVGRKPVDLTINVQIPYMPITSTGKEPDLEWFLKDLRAAVGAAAKKCQRANPSKTARSCVLPALKKGRPSDADREQYARDLRSFADMLKEIDSRVDFKASSRGWCYVLENERGLPKGEFDRAQDLINDCRKSGLLPIDFTGEDEARAPDCVEECHGMGPEEYAADLIGKAVGGWDTYAPVSFWDYQQVFIQMVVEKIDLKSLFLPICREYHVPIINSRGWSDLNMRVGLMRRFKEHEEKGRVPVLLVCGDHDPVGLQIPDLLPAQLEELAQAVGWSPQHLRIDRFGLNEDFINTNNLTWIEGLTTASGKDLGDSDHKHHKAPYVQDYIRKFGKRKVEANALVVRPKEGRRLCREAIGKHLDLRAIATYEAALAEQRQRVKEALPSAVRRVLGHLATGK
jgi:hypothetical protein